MVVDTHRLVVVIFLKPLAMTDYQPEWWRDILDFSPYAVSNHGQVKNADSDVIKRASLNQQGIPNVLFMLHGVQYRRAVPRLVATHFLPEPPRETFDTPINLDGCRTNNYVGNLAWRPRWFAIQYHAQFKTPLSFKGPVACTTTGEVFEDIRVAAKTYGLLEKELIYAAHNHTPVFPTWQEFELSF